MSVLTTEGFLTFTTEEYKALDKKFGKLCYYVAHSLQKKNIRNNYTDDFEDIVQELKFALLTAAAYYKRQVWIERCFEVLRTAVRDKYLIFLVDILVDLWSNRTRHGANRQKFGPRQEKLLAELVSACVPTIHQPNRHDTLKINAKFSTYCKSVLWNKEKNMGKRITREKSIRSGLVSISEFDYLAKE